MVNLKLNRSPYYLYIITSPFLRYSKAPMKPTSLTKRHIDILVLLYRFRFLRSHHIQKLLGHKHHNRIYAWLNELTGQGYIRKYYIKQFKTKPASYSLTVKSRTFFKANPQINGIRLELLDRVWREGNYSVEFREHCLAIADIGLNFIESAKQDEAMVYFYTKVDMDQTAHIIQPLPDGYVAIEKENEPTQRYFIDIFGDKLPPKAMRVRVRQYIHYYKSQEWQNNTDKPFPDILLIAPNERMKNHLFYYIRNKTKEGLGLRFHLRKRLCDQWNRLLITNLLCNKNSVIKR